MAAPKRIAVFRALMLGDLLCATPALRALRAAWPHARPGQTHQRDARELAQRLRSVDDFECFPGWPGLSEQAPPGQEALHAFLRRLSARHFDLAIQLHGSGAVSNPLVARFGARRLAGFAGPGAWRPDSDAERFLPWPVQGQEIERLLALTDHLGMPRRGEAMDFPLRPEDHLGARAWLPAGEAYAVVHPGARWSSRRWPAERFAEVGDALARRGLRVVLTGSAEERELGSAVAAAMDCAPLDLTGRTDLWTLGALVASARLVVSNDTGLSHVAAALETPSVVVSCGSDVARWAPLAHERHQVLSHDLPCRPCVHRDCPVGHGCALALDTEAVVHAALGRLEAPRDAALAA
jgi:ADP-heptose:LPS heptosyltransferase